MKVKPKEVFVNLPIVLTFQDADKIPEFCANVNTLLHGKVKMKYEELGTLGGQFIAIFYLQRNNEFAELRTDFKEMIEREEISSVSEPVAVRKPMSSDVALQEAINTMQDEGGTPSLLGGEK